MITTEESMFTLVRGIRQLVAALEEWNIPKYGKSLALAIIAMLAGRDGAGDCAVTGVVSF